MRDTWLLCRVGARINALPLGDIIEIMRPLPVEPLEAMPAFMLGFSVIRSEAMPVVDLAKLHGTASTNIARFVTVRSGERSVALAVDEVIGVRALPAQPISSASPLLEGATSEAIAGIGRLGDQLLLVLKSARIVPDEVWKAIDARGVHE